MSYQDPFGLCTKADGGKDCDKMISAGQSVQVLADAMASGEWTYSQYPSGNKRDPNTALPGQQLGDSTDMCRQSVQNTLGPAWKSAYKASTSMFKSGDHPGFTEVDAADARPGDVIVRGGHAGMYIGTDKDGNAWGWANNGSPTKADGTGYADHRTGAVKFTQRHCGGGAPQYYRPIMP